MAEFRPGQTGMGASTSSFFSGSDQRQHPQRGFTAGPSSGQFDIFDWQPAYTSCQRFFLDHAQHDQSVQAVCALVNIRLPLQWTPSVTSSRPKPSPTVNTSPQYPLYMRQNPATPANTNALNWVSLVPFIRRLVVTGFDKESVLHGFFGDDWRKGVGPVQECERRNYLFAAKSGGWINVKTQYDMGPQETVPFLQPPQDIELAEIENAEKLWSQWLAMEDWMVGPRAPDDGMADYARRGDGNQENK